MSLPAKICHAFHPNHQLSLVTTMGFGCDGCKQFGQSSEQHYRCEACDFDLHAQCATAPAVLLEHPLFVGSKFVLIENETIQNGYMTCQACGEDTVGFRYMNKDPDMYLHPCCAVLLPTRVVQDDRVFQLLKDDSSAKCGICSKDKSQSSSLSYRTSYDDGEHVYLHVSCLVRIHNQVTGYKNWQASAPIVQGVMRKFERKKINAAPGGVATQTSNGGGGATQTSNGGGGATAMQTAGTVFSALNLVAKLVTLDPDGIEEHWQELKERFQ
ncbi:hypothetical protein ACUV84_035429 [Puccinellia chinampoensis]